MIYSTFGTLKYNLPLYILSVRNNSIFCPVAYILTENETEKALRQGIKIPKSWNPNMKPDIMIIMIDKRQTQCQVFFHLQKLEFVNFIENNVEKVFLKKRSHFTN